MSGWKPTLRRRDVIAGAGAIAYRIAARAARAQKPLPMLGYLSLGAQNPTSSALLDKLRRGLAEKGYVEGRNLQISVAWAEFSLDRLLDFAADLVHRAADVIVAASGPLPMLAAEAATAKIPIVFLLAEGPVSEGVVASRDHTRGNATGIMVRTAPLLARRLDLLRRVAAPDLTGLLVNSSNPQVKPQIVAAESTARALGMHLVVLNARSPIEVERAFATLARQKIATLALSDDPLFLDQARALAWLAARDAVTVVHPYRQSVDAGGLMSYGVDASAAWQLAGDYAGRILAGAAPTDVSVAEASGPAMAINLKAAETLGITLPYGILREADELVR